MKDAYVIIFAGDNWKISKRAMTITHGKTSKESGALAGVEVDLGMYAPKV